MKTVRKTAAGAVLVTVMPFMVGVAVEPYSDDSVMLTWFKGAGMLTVALVLQWASKELTQ